MILAITGPRDAVPALHEPRIEVVIRWMVGDNDVTEFWHGGTGGVDRIGATVAEAVGVPVIREFAADWKAPCVASCRPGHRGRRQDGGEFCPAAGNYRNDVMMRGLSQVTGQRTALLAFPFRGKITSGTGDCRDRALWYGIPCLIFPLDPLPPEMRRPRRTSYTSPEAVAPGKASL